MCAVVFLSPLSLASAQNTQDATPALSEKTRDRYEEILLKNPQPGTAFDRLYKSYADAGELDAWAARLADKAKAAPTPQDAARYHLITGYLFQRRAADAQAIAAFDAAAKADPTNPRPFAARGILLSKTGKHLPAAESLAQAIALNPPKQELQDLYKALGRAYAAANQPENAVKAWLTLADLFPQDTAMREELAGLLIQEGRLPDAAVQYEKLRAATQDAYQKVRAVFALAQIAAAQNKPDQAVALLSEQLASLAPESWLRAETHRRLELTFTRAPGGLPGLADFYAKWITTQPGDIDVRLARASLLRRLNKPDDALQAYRDTLVTAPDRADVRTALADMLLEQNHRDQAIALYEKNASANPADPVGWERLGNVLLTDPAKSPDQQKQAALAAWKNIFDKAPQPDPARALKAAELLRKAGLADEALDHYAKAAKLAPDQTEYDEYAGLYLAELGRQDQAIARLQKIAQGPRNTPSNRLRLAQLLIQLKAYPQALTALDGPSSSASGASGAEAYAAQSLRVTLLTTQKRYPEALAAIDTLENLADTPEHAREARVSRADFHKAQNTLNAAAQTLAAKIKANPNPNDLEMLAIYQRALGQGAIAADTAAEAAALDPANPNRLAFALDLSIETGDFTRAFTQAGLLLQRQPHRRTLYAQALSDLVSKNSTNPAAITRAKNLIALIPDAPQPYILLATLQSQQSDLPAALATLTKGAQQVPSDTTILLALARLQASANQPAQAKETYQRALESASDSDQKAIAITELTRLNVTTGQADAFLQKLAEKARDTDFEPGTTFALATAAREAGQLEKAQAALEESLLRRPNDAQTLETLISITRSRGQHDQALQYALQLKKLKPDDPQLTQNIAHLLLDLGRAQEAVTFWQSAPRPPGASAMSEASGGAMALQHARALVQEGSNAQAIQVLTQAAQIFPEDWNLAMEAARITQEAGRPEKAAALFDALIRMPVPPTAQNDAQAQFPNISYLGHKGRAPALNRWVNLRTIQTRTVTEINNASAPTISGRVSAAVTRYNPPDLPSAQLSALVHRLHLAQSVGRITPYLHTLATEAGHRLPDMPPDSPTPATQPAANRPARTRLLQALLLLDLTQQAQDTARQFHTQDPGFSDAATLDALLTLSTALEARNLMLSGPLPDIPPTSDPQAAAKAAANALALVERSAPQALSDLAILLAESALSRGSKSQAAPYLELALKNPTSLEARVSLLGMLVRANDSTRASQLLQTITPDASALAASSKNANANLTSVLDELTTIAGQAMRPQTGALGVDIAMSCLQTIASGEGGRIWLQGQPALPTFNLEQPLIPTLPPSSALLGAEFANTLQQWSQQAAQQPSMNSALATHAMQWALQAPPNQKAFAAIAAASILRSANLTDDALAVLQDATRPTAKNTPEIPGITDVKLALLHLLISQRKFDQAKTLVASLNTTTADPALDLPRQLSVARLYLALAARDSDQIKTLIPQLENNQNTLREAQTLSRLRTLHNLATLTPATTPATPTGVIRTNPPPPPPPPVNTPQTDAQAIAAFIQAGKSHEAQTIALRIIAQSARPVLASAATPEEANFALAALARINRFDAALTAADAAWQSQSDDPETCARYLLLLNARGDWAKADAVLTKLVASSPAHLSMRYEYALFLHAQGRFAQASREFDHVLARRPALIQSEQEVFESYYKANRLPDLVKTLAAIPPVERLTILQRQQNQSLDWIPNIAQEIAPADPKGAQAILQHYITLTGELPKPDLTADLLNLAITNKDAPAAIQLITQELSRPPIPPPDALPETPARARNTPPSIWLFESASSTSDVHRPLALQTLNLLANTTQLDTLDKALAAIPAADPPVRLRESLILTLRAMIAAQRTPPNLAPARDLLPLPAPSLPRAAISTLALSLPSDPGSFQLADQLAASVIKDAATPQFRIAHADLLPLLDLRARFALSQNKPEDALSLYTTLLKYAPPQSPTGGDARPAPPWAQGINLHAASFKARLAYLPAAVKAGAADPAVDLLEDTQDILPTITDDNLRAQLQSTLPPLTALPEIQSALKAKITRLEAFKPSGHENPAAKPLLNLYILANQPEKAAEILPKAFPGFPKTTLRQQAYARTRIAKQLAADGKGAQARALLLPLITQGNPSALGSLDQYPSAFADAPALQELAATLKSTPIDLRRQARADAWLQNTADTIATASQKITDPTNAKPAQEAALQLILAAHQWPPTPERSDSALLPSAQPSLPTLALSQFRALGKPADAYPWYRDLLFKSTSNDPGALPAADLFSVALPAPSNQPKGPKTENPLASFIALALESSNAQDLTDTATAALTADGIQPFIARRTLLLLALAKNDIPQAQKRLAQDFPDPLAFEDLQYDPSLPIIILSCLDHKDLVQPALDLYIQSAQTAFTTDAARTQISTLYPLILTRLQTSGQAALIPPFKDRLQKSTNITPPPLTPSPLGRGPG
jgi:tetratricopeptide (TPR) repeat protein